MKNTKLILLVSVVASTMFIIKNLYHLYVSENIDTIVWTHLLTNLLVWVTIAFVANSAGWIKLKENE